MFIQPESRESSLGDVAMKENYRRLLEFVHHGKVDLNLHGSTVLHDAYVMSVEFFVEFLPACCGLDTERYNYECGRQMWTHYQHRDTTAQ